MVMVDVVDCSLQVDSQPKLVGLVWGSAATCHCLTFIRRIWWTLAVSVTMTAPMHHTHCLSIIVIITIKYQHAIYQYTTQVWEMLLNHHVVMCSHYMRMKFILGFSAIYYANPKTSIVKLQNHARQRFPSKPAKCDSKHDFELCVVFIHIFAN